MLVLCHDTNVCLMGRVLTLSTDTALCHVTVVEINLMCVTAHSHGLVLLVGKYPI